MDFLNMTVVKIEAKLLEIWDIIKKEKNIQIVKKIKRREGLVMNDNEIEVISQIIEERLIANWNKCDGFGSAEYNRITDECILLRSIIRKLNLSLPAYIMARF